MTYDPRFDSLSPDRDRFGEITITQYQAIVGLLKGEADDCERELLIRWAEDQAHDLGFNSSAELRDQTKPKPRPSLGANVVSFCDYRFD